ncbi:Glycoside Hydrolase Family 61 [Rhizoctonia solani]|uniref:AA9 family lytic polysaccharide monooxygenase n=1 Tax=Rhizoctonia solani TaxID=456999 RepID=A0A8H7I789_9AGAM|nr:Glycoside Hydrolase Family 61 [Rhizoctonia solani]
MMQVNAYNEPAAGLKRRKFKEQQKINSQHALQNSRYRVFGCLWCPRSRYVPAILVNGVDQGDKCVRKPASNSPVTSVTSNDIVCNAGAASTSGICSVAAGTTVSVEMHQQPGDRSCSNEAIGGNHDGPTIIYMAKVDNAASASGSSANWFKVAQTGLLTGQYLLRAEVIALHVASSVGGAQFYMSCYQLQVTGGGSASPATVKFPGAYKATDPGILFNLYGSYTTYTVPGPSVYSG